MIARMEHNRYIGPTAKFKEFFDFLPQKLPASQVKRIAYPSYAEISRLARFEHRAAYTQETSERENEPAQL